jgi:hypothetical protein
MAAIADLNMLSSNQPTTTSCEEPVTLASAACCQASKDSQEEDSGQEKAEEENMAEVFVDCEGGESRHFVKKRMVSMSMVGMSMESKELEQEEIHTPPVLPQEQNLTIEDVAALCSSPIKFLFKCSEIEHFNKFLRAQKKRLISSSSFLHHDNNNDHFHIIHSGAECGTLISVLPLPPFPFFYCSYFHCFCFQCNFKLLLHFGTGQISSTKSCLNRKILLSHSSL